MDIQETWKQSPLAPNHVLVSNVGNVRTIDRLAHCIRNGKESTQLRKGTKLSPWIGKHGYLIVSIKENGKRIKYLVHRLVASAFCSDYDPILSVNHIDCNKLNNNLCNLEWVTLGKNTELQWKDGLVDLRGEKHPSARLTDLDIFTIRQSTDKVSFLASSYNVSISLIYKIKQRKRWKHLKD